MSLDVLMAVTVKVAIIWNVTLCSNSVDRYQPLAASIFWVEEMKRSIFYHESRDSTFLQNVGMYQPNYVASHPRIQKSFHSCQMKAVCRNGFETDAEECVWNVMGSILKAGMRYMFWLLHDWKHFYWFMWLSFYLFLNILSLEWGSYWSTSQNFIALLETVNNVYNMV